ncbi:hypothetical protein BDV26DRAFT_139040 [Aspergillus bertholletiae]|uniref:Uncharacterized protein n=1 Tax=Aspergillus bertholletiae TaxID=1226010 RepID=A0A5N7BNM2_9EURO|nr:hypothetical protein BDV26DRAFT_139040 [Aspergillus bertholletiae]
MLFDSVFNRIIPAHKIVENIMSGNRVFSTFFLNVVCLIVCCFVSFAISQDCVIQGIVLPCRQMTSVNPHQIMKEYLYKIFRQHAQYHAGTSHIVLNEER